jgi:hypothetical protein
MLVLPEWTSYQNESILLGATCVLVYLVSYFLLDLKVAGKAERSKRLREAFNSIEKKTPSNDGSENKVLPPRELLLG